jgi:hypothetical protein
MDFLAGRTKVDMKPNGRVVTVPSNDFARLKYYLNCVNNCFNDDGEDLIPGNLRDYDRYYSLPEGEKLAILALCAGLLNVKNLIGKVFFLLDELEDGYGNRFYEITETVELVALGIRADRVVGIGGSKKEVTTIMLVTEGWIDTNFVNPMKEAAQSLQRQTYVAPRVTYSSYQSPSPSPKPSPSPSPNPSPSPKPKPLSSLPSKGSSILPVYADPEPIESPCEQRLSNLLRETKKVLTFLIFFLVVGFAVYAFFHYL